MNLSVGIVGLPNVGKSSLFNLLTSQKVLAANYPFATIDPNVGIVTVPDERLEKIAEIAKPEKIVPAYVEFVDIAGLVRGASKGQGLGNKFLSHIKNVSIILHLVRNFKDENITHVEHSVDQVRDIELVETELILKDIETVENRISSIKAQARFNKDLAEVMQHLQNILNTLSQGKLAQELEYPTLEFIKKERQNLFLLTDKPVIYLLNTNILNNHELDSRLIEKLNNKQYIVMDVKLETELLEMNEEERLEFLKEFNITNTAKNRLIKLSYETLGLISFFTQGPKEVRAWTIKKGTFAPEASGAIHSDFQKNFICIEVVKYTDFIDLGGWEKAKEKGKLILGGKDYIVEDGDIIVVKHN